MSLNIQSNFQSGSLPNLASLYAGTLSGPALRLPRPNFPTLIQNSWAMSEQFASLLSRGNLPLLVPKTSLQFFVGTSLFQNILQNTLRQWGIWLPQMNMAAPIFNTPVPQNVWNPNASVNSEQSFLSSVEADLQSKIYSPEPDVQKKLDDLNSRRTKEGKAPINFQQITREIENALSDPKLSDKQKKDKVGAIKNRLGLSKGDMKKLFTKRLAKLHQQAADKIQTRIDGYEKAFKDAETIYGKGSPQAQAAQMQLQQAQGLLESAKKNYVAKAGVYKSMFPGFWSKLGGFFKKVGTVFKKIAQVVTKIMDFVSPFLNFIPGIGQAISAGWNTLKGAVQLLKGNWKGFLNQALDFAGSLIPGADKFIKWGKTAFNAISGAMKGNFSGLLNEAFSLASPYFPKANEWMNIRFKLESSPEDI